MCKSVITAIIIILIFFYTSIFILKENERGVVLRFNKVLRSNEKKPLIYKPGLHFKIPLIESVKILDARIQTLDNQVDHFMTRDKNDLTINSYIKWRISDFGCYYLSTGGDFSRAEMLLKHKFFDHLRFEISHLDMKNIISDNNGYLMIKIRNMLNFNFKNIENKSLKLLVNNAFTKVEKSLQKKNDKIISIITGLTSLGIKIIDVQIKQINLPIEVSRAICNRMRIEHEAIARRFRSEGQEEAEKLRAIADYEVTKKLAEAERLGCILRGEGDAEAAKLFVDAFRKDPDFYAFIRSLIAYENSFQNNSDIMILNWNNDFFRYMQSSDNSIH